MSRSNETKNIKWHEICKWECRLDAIVCMTNNVGIKVNADANVKYWLIKKCVIRDIFGILVIVNANAINYVILVSI